MKIILSYIPETVVLDSSIFTYTDTITYYESIIAIPSDAIEAKKLFERRGKDHKYNGNIATRLMPEITLEITINTLEELIELSKALHTYDILLDIENGDINWAYYSRE